MHPEIQDKLERFKKYAEMVMPDQPDWVWTGEDPTIRRCCTTLNAIIVNPDLGPDRRTNGLWYEGEIDCASYARTGEIRMKGYGV